MIRKNKIRMKITHRVIVLLFIITISTACDRIGVLEYTYVESYIDETYCVSTYVLVYDEIGRLETCEMYAENTVKYPQIDSVRAIQREQARKCKKLLESKIDSMRYAIK